MSKIFNRLLRVLNFGQLIRLFHKFLFYFNDLDNRLRLNDLNLNSARCTFSIDRNCSFEYLIQTS